MATTAAPAPAQTEDKQWFALEGDAVAGRARRRHAGRALAGRGRHPAREVRPERLRGRGDRAALACVRAPVPRPDADRPAGGRDRQHLAPPRARHRPGPALPDAVQRRPRPQPGGEGGRRRRRAAEDDDRQGEGAPRRRARRGPGGAARSGRHRLDRGRRRRARGRAAAEGGDARGGRVGADRREHAGVEGRRDRHADRRAARRPDRHGLHEHQRDEGRRRARSSPRPGCRPRSATSRTCCPRRTSRPRR